MAEFKIQINDRMLFKKCKSKQQQCVYCGKLMGMGRTGLIMRNKGEGIALKKNLWLHTTCIEDFGECIKSYLFKNKTKIVAEEI